MSLDRDNGKRVRSRSPGSLSQKRSRLLSPPSSIPKKDIPEHTEFAAESNLRHPAGNPLLVSDCGRSGPQNVVDTVPRERRGQYRGHKRKWTADEDCNLQPASKQTKTAPLDQTLPTNVDDRCGNLDNCSSIDHWATTGLWPASFSTMSNQERSAPPKKRQRTPSYTQSSKDGDVPKAHTPASEKTLAEHGIQMGEQDGRLLVSDTSKTLCNTLLSGVHEEPQYPLYPVSQFLAVWERVRSRNEARIFRDITPSLVPSAELLFVSGCEDLEHVAEEVSADWTKSKTLGGPKPRPDFAAGIYATAFTDKELLKLKNHTSFERPTLFTDNMYFPFLLCEAKCGDQGINRADRQNVHSSSMAVNAIVQLYKVLGDQTVLQLSGQILVFSISHDNERVKIYGHYAVIDEEKTMFYRYPVESFTLNFHDGQGRKQTYDFVREIYRAFYPQHLKRIQGALAEMDDPCRASSTGASVTDPQDPDSSVLSSQDSAVFKIPDRPASQSQIAFLREQLTQQERQSKEQLAQQERQSKEQLAQQERQSKEQLAQQERQSKEHAAQLEKLYKEQMAQQEKQMEMLQQLLNRQ